MPVDVEAIVFENRDCKNSFALGVSEGEIQTELLAEVHHDTQSGIFVKDGTDVLDRLQANRGADSFLLGDPCGGMITGILLAQDDARVQGLLSLGMTVTLEMGTGEGTRYAIQGEPAALRKGYVRRLFSPKSWLRLFTFQSDFKTIRRFVAQLFTKKSATNSDAATEANRQQIDTDANPQFRPAFFKLTQEDRKVLLIFSVLDRLFWEFEEKFAQPYAAQLAEVKDNNELHVIDKANHVFSFREWEKDMLEVAEQWLETNFPQARPIVVD